ncbi:MAG: type I methionyl aminopeptidase [Candidatus Peregrinibacteria bacterium]
MPRIIIKTEEEIQAMREGGKILANCLKETAKLAIPGASTLDLDLFAEKYIRDHNGTPSFKGYHGFPATLCTNVNSVVVHGIPKKDEILKEGDIISIDCGVIYKGLHTDSTVLVGVSNISDSKKKFISVAGEALAQAIATIKPGAFVGDISQAIEHQVTKNGYSVVTELTGHGVGRNLHESPVIPNRYEGRGDELAPGMTLAIEPIFAMGSPKIETLRDKWTIVTLDNSPAAQIEHTVLVTESGYEILTKCD